MIRRPSESTAAEDDDGTDAPIATPRETVSISKTQEEVAIARCPLCRAALIARQGRAGPFFYCGCLRQPEKRAS